MRKTLAAIGAIAAITLSLIGGPASAATSTTAAAAAAAPRATSDIQLRWCSWGSGDRCYPRRDAVIPSGSTVNAVCWGKGENVTGAYRTDHWIYVAYGSLKGWAHSSRIVNSGLHVQVATRDDQLSSCNATRQDISATNFALQFVNRASMPKGLARELFPEAEWGYSGKASLVGRLSGNSPKLPYWGYYATGKEIPGSGKAIDIFNQHYAATATTSGVPPMGALVFYGPDITNGFQGLEGISVGSGKVFIAPGKRTEDRNSHSWTKIVDVTGVPSGQYLGWVMP